MSSSKKDLLVGFAFVVIADLYNNFLVKSFEKIQQLICCEAIKTSAQQVRYFGPFNTEKSCHFLFLEVTVLHDFQHLNSDLCMG